MILSVAPEAVALSGGPVWLGPRFRRTDRTAARRTQVRIVCVKDASNFLLTAHGEGDETTHRPAASQLNPSWLPRTVHMLSIDASASARASLADLGQSFAVPGEICPISTGIRSPEFGRLRANLAKLVHIRAPFDQIRPFRTIFGRTRPTLARLDQIWPESTSVVRFRPSLTDFGGAEHWRGSRWWRMVHALQAMGAGHEPPPRTNWERPAGCVSGWAIRPTTWLSDRTLWAKNRKEFRCVVQRCLQPSRPASLSGQSVRTRRATGPRPFRAVDRRRRAILGSYARRRTATPHSGTMRGACRRFRVKTPLQGTSLGSTGARRLVGQQSPSVWRMRQFLIGTAAAEATRCDTEAEFASGTKYRPISSRRRGLAGFRRSRRNGA